MTESRLFKLYTNSVGCKRLPQDLIDSSNDLFSEVLQLSLLKEFAARGIALSCPTVTQFFN